MSMSMNGWPLAAEQAQVASRGLCQAFPLRASNEQGIASKIICTSSQHHRDLTLAAVHHSPPHSPFNHLYNTSGSTAGSSLLS
jgi:hypothetical protein